MLRKNITPIFGGVTNLSMAKEPTITGTKVEYRLFGLLLYRKTMYLPSMYGITEWREWYYRI